MLSRVASNLYWMSRYLERADHTARTLQVNLTQMLDESPESAEERWQKVWTGLLLEGEQTLTSEGMMSTLTLNRVQPSSIYSCISLARHNAHQVRQLLSSEIWLHINRLYHRLNQMKLGDILHAPPDQFLLDLVCDSIHLLRGLVDTTMLHKEQWHFMQIGRFIEQNLMTVGLLEANYRNVDVTHPVTNPLEWVALLKTCLSFEPYVATYSARIHLPSIAELLLLDHCSPRSIHYGANNISSSLQYIAETTGVTSSVQRLAGRLRADLSYRTADDIVAEGVHTYCYSIRKQCERIHEALYETYINPTFEGMVVSASTQEQTQSL